MNRAVAVALVTAIAACHKPPPPPAPSPAVRPPALSALPGQPVIVLPTQYVRVDTMGWSSQIANQRAYLASLDSLITTTLRDRGLGDPWKYAADLERASQRNPTLASDPRALAAQGLRPTVRRLNNRLSEPLASQIRALIALTEARLAILPVEVRFERVGSEGRAVLRVAVLDGRTSTIQWLGDVESDTVAAVSPAVATSLATHLANLIVPPQ